MDKNNQNDVDSLFDEDFNFRAITDGLGFHHSVKNKNEVQRSLKSKATELQKDFDARIKLLSNQQNSIREVDMGDLSPFYQKSESTHISIPTTNADLKNAESNEAGTFERLGAWIIDFVMISVLYTVVFLSTIILTNTPLSFLRDLILGKEFFITLMPLFIGFYLFYFSFFDKTNFSSPGKKILGLKVVTLEGRNASMIQALGRALITLAAIPSAGLLVFIDAQSRLTDTKVIKK